MSKTQKAIDSHSTENHLCLYSRHADKVMSEIQMATNDFDLTLKETALFSHYNLGNKDVTFKFDRTKDGDWSYKVLWK